MRILYLCTFYHRAMLFRQQMNALIGQGHDVFAFNTAQYGEGISEKFRPLMDDKVYHCECWNKWDRLFFFPRQWKIEKQMCKAVDVASFDLIHAHLMLSSGYTALRMKRKYGTPYVVSVRSTDLSGFIRLPGFKRMARRIMENANGILFLSHTSKQCLLSMYSDPVCKQMIEEKSSVIGNCIESFWEENTVASEKNFLEEKELRILTVAKIRPVKNIPVAAAAVEELNKRGYSARLTLIGENQDQNELDKILKYSCITWLPFMRKEELIDAYREHDLFLLPSVAETFGRVYAEAMTQGLPVLYTEGQGFDGTFPEGEVGYSVPANDPKAIADRIELILKNYSSISRNCVENCKAFYEKNITEQLDAFYQGCFSRNQKDC